MSSSEAIPTGRLTLTSDTPGTQFAVVDSTLRPVETDSDWNDQPLAAGVYLVEARVGSTTEKRMVTVPPGMQLHEALSVRIRVAAPIDGAGSTNETHAALASGLSGELAQGVGPDAGLVLVLRNLRGSDAEQLHRDDLEVLDQTFSRVSAWPSDWVGDPYSDEAIARAARLEPGPYVLRTTRRTRGTEERIAQTLWLAAGWQTLVFVPNTAAGPDPRGLSVQMTRLGQPWYFNDYEARAVEGALAGLRDGVSSVDRGTVQRMLDGKFDNPMLGILGLHSMMLTAAVSDRLAHTVVSNLRNLVGDHPDVVALATTLSDWPGNEGVAWPPMLERSYRSCLLPADRRYPGALVDGSLAEEVTPFIRIPGPWLRWTDLDARRPAPDHSVADYTFGAVDLVLAAIEEISAFQDLSLQEAVTAIGPRGLADRMGLPQHLLDTSLRIIGLAGGPRL